MTREDQNFQFLIDTYLSNLTEHEQLWQSARSLALRDNHFDLPINPWLDFFEVMGLAWMSGAVSEKHLALLRSDSLVRWDQVPDLSALSSKKSAVATRDVLLRVVGFLRFDDPLPARYRFDTPFAMFPVFADLHAGFRRRIPAIVEGLLWQSSVTHRISSVSDAIPQLDHWLSDGKEEQQLFLHAVASLSEYASQFTLMFVDYAEFFQEAAKLYRPWIGAIDSRVREALCAIADRDPSVTVLRREALRMVLISAMSDARRLRETKASI